MGAFRQKWVFRGCVSTFELIALTCFLIENHSDGWHLQLVEILTFGFCHIKVNISFLVPSRSSHRKQIPGVESWLNQICLRVINLSVIHEQCMSASDYFSFFPHAK